MTIPVQQSVYDIIAQFKADLFAGEASQVVLMGEQWLAIERSLTADIEALVQRVEQLAAQGDVEEWQIFRLAEYRVLQARVAEEIQRYTDEIFPLLDQWQSYAARIGARNAYSLTQAVAAASSASVDVQFMRLDARAVENIVAIARAGNPLYTLMAAAYPQAFEGLLDELVSGVAVGRHPDEIVRRMREIGLSRGFNHVELVARDQFNRAYREASRQQYAESGVVASYTRMAAHDTRTCLACLALDGKVYPTDELMEVHPQDRCAMVPTIAGYPPITRVPAREWFETLPERTQREMMGLVRYRAWKADQFAWAEMASTHDHPTWGPGARVTPLRQLLR